MLFPLAEYWWFYAVFTAFVLVLLAVDLGVFHRKDHEITIREAAKFSAIWISMAMLFNVLLYYYAQSAFSQDPRLLATPLFLALMAIEMSDIVFAIDSVPAIFALTREPLIVFTSNVFAILGLRSLYFVLAGAVARFTLLRFGLAGVLMFIGLKMIWLNQAWGGHFPIGWSLAIIGTLVGGSIVASLLVERPKDGTLSKRAG